VPRAIFISGVIIITLYILGTMAVLAAIPSGDINLVEGLIDTLTLFFGESPAGKALVLILGLGALFSFFSNGVTWALGCNRAAAEAAQEGELPKIFALEDSKRGTPVGSAVLMGLVSTLCLVMYGFMSGSNEDLFWSLFAFSAVIFLLPYQGMMLAFLKMRRVDAHHPRPYKVPGGTGAARLAASLCITILAISIFLFMYTPGSGFEWAVVGGVIVTLIIGEIVIRFAENHRN
jgi:amino acid transporter